MIELREITPYLTIYGPVAAVIVILDYVLTEPQKTATWNKIVAIARIGERPVSLAFYGLTTFVSCTFTLLILSIGGFAQAQGADGSSVLILLKSSGPILVAVFLKIVLIDYILAIKTFYFVRSFERASAEVLANGKISRSMNTMSAVVLIVCDLMLTGIITAGFINWAELFQASQMKEVHTLTKPAAEFFDTLNFMAQETIQKSFYALNGSLQMYLALLVAATATGAIKHLNVSGITNNLFKLIAAFLGLFILVIAVARVTSA